MTTPVQTPAVELLGNGATVVFPFPYLVQDATHLKVYIAGILQVGGYTVAGLGNPAGGSVTFGAPPANLARVMLRRAVPLSQLADYVPYDPFPAEVNEQALDKLTQEVQDMGVSVAGSLRVPDSEMPGSFNTQLPSAAARAGFALGFDALGNLALGLSFLALGTAVSFASVEVTGAAPPATEGIYRPASNTLGLAARGLPAAQFTTPAGGVNYLSSNGGTTGNGVSISARGGDTDVLLNLSSKGASSVDLYTNTFAARQVSIVHTPSTVNYISLTGGVTGAAAVMGARGSDTNVTLSITSQGAGSIFLGTRSGAAAQVIVGDVVNSVNQVILTGSATGSDVAVRAGGNDTNVNLLLSSHGSGSVQIRSGGNARIIALFANINSSVNYLQFNPNVAGGSPLVIAAGADTNINLLLYAKGTGSVYLAGQSGVAVAFVANSPASGVNYFGTTGAVTTANPTLFVDGSDTNISMFIAAKGTGNVGFASGGGQQFAVLNTASAVNYLSASGAPTSTALTLTCNGSDSNISLNILMKGNSAFGITDSAGGTYFQAGRRSAGVPTRFLRVQASDGSANLLLDVAAGNFEIGTQTQFSKRVYLAQDTGAIQTVCGLWAGTGVPNNANGSNGDFYFRGDTPGVANQKLYIKSAGAWVALVL